MKDQKDIKVKYRSGIMQSGEFDGEPYVEYEHDYVSVNLNHVKRYNSALMVLMGISGCELHLIEWLSANMTESGYVHNNEVTRSGFISFHNRHKRKDNKPYSDHSVIKAFKNLQKSGLLIPEVRGVYSVNPDYYFKGDESDRIKSIRLVMEFQAGIATKTTREVTK